MALKSYHKETLNDNWYEEREPPLNGVLPRDGVKEYTTTTCMDFNGRKPSVPKSKLRMIGDHNIDVAMHQMSAKDYYDGFRAVIPRPNAEQEKRYLESTHRATFINHFPSTSTQSENRNALVPAGGPGARNLERGKAASGAMGEVYRVNPEPQKDTQAQRAWMYSKDPMIVAIQNRNQQATQVTHPTTVQNETKREHFRRQSTSITMVPMHHTGVFVDD